VNDVQALLLVALFAYVLVLYLGSGRTASGAALLAVGLHVTYVLARGFSLGRLPLIGVHDTVLFFALVTAVSALLVERTRSLQGLLSRTLPLVIGLVLLALFSKRVDTPLPPVLNTYWFELHVALSFISYALFTLGMGLGLLYLKSGDAVQERLQYSTILTGYSLFSLSMVFGGIWAQLAWGTYWLWTPKELWTTILWLYYSLYLHGRLVRGWSGRPVVWMGIAGFALMMFLYLGVSVLMKSSHSFS